MLLTCLRHVIIFKASLYHKVSRIRRRLPSVETSESADIFQRNAERASYIQKALFLRNFDGISK